MEIRIDHSSAVLSMTYRGYKISIADNVTHYSEECVAVRGCVEYPVHRIVWLLMTGEHPKDEVDIRVYDEVAGDDLTSVIGKIIKAHTPPGYIKGTGYMLQRVFNAIDRLCDLYLTVKPSINNAK